MPSSHSLGSPNVCCTFTEKNFEICSPAAHDCPAVLVTHKTQSHNLVKATSARSLTVPGPLRYRSFNLLYVPDDYESSSALRRPCCPATRREQILLRPH